MPDTLTITAPDDWHIHLRDDDALPLTVDHAARQFSRAIVMPNLNPPVTTAEMAKQYEARIRAATKIPGFTPLMVLYLTDKTSVETIREAHAQGIHACKLYPAGATTNSDSGVTKLQKIYPALEAMEKAGMKLLIHGEVTRSNVDIFDREKAFLDETLRPLCADFGGLKTVLEHITTSDAVEFVTSASDNVAATITPHHLLFNRNHMLAGGIRPHYFCLPILKRDTHQLALISAATSGNPRFFIGTDSAPHPRHKKEAACGCAGCYSAHAAIELYAEAFERADAIGKLEGFASHYGADFYGMPRNRSTITLEKKPWQLPERFRLGEDELIPLMPGETLLWRVTKNKTRLP